MMSRKLPASRLAPPTSRPSTSGSAIRSAAFSALHRAPVLDPDRLGGLGHQPALATRARMKTQASSASTAVAAWPGADGPEGS